MYFNNFFALDYYTDTYWGIDDATAEESGSYLGLYRSLYANIYKL